MNKKRSIDFILTQVQAEIILAIKKEENEIEEGGIVSYISLKKAKVDAFKEAFAIVDKAREFGEYASE